VQSPNIEYGGAVCTIDKEPQGEDKIKIISNVVVKTPCTDLWENHHRWPKTLSKEGNSKKRRNYMSYAITSHNIKEMERLPS
jgi:hypothetical protein